MRICVSSLVCFLLFIYFTNFKKKIDYMYDYNHESMTMVHDSTTIAQPALMTANLFNVPPVVLFIYLFF